MEARAARVSARQRYTITLDQSLQRGVCRYRNQAAQNRGGRSLVVLVAGITTFALYLRGRNANTAIKSIAVMPFVNEGGNAELEYLSDGMTDTLISSLSQLPNLNVKARSSVFRYKGNEKDPQTIGKELNVQAILAPIAPEMKRLHHYLSSYKTPSHNFIRLCRQI